jgi:hypothetical protein
LLLTFGQHYKAQGVRFFVYESTAQNGPYTLLADQANDFVQDDMGPLNFPLDLNAPLKAGRYYILGVETLHGDVTFCYETAAASQAVTFGELLPSGYASQTAVPAQIDLPSGPGNTEQYISSIVLK